MWLMVASEFIKARLPKETKSRVKALAEREGLSESAWIKRLIVRELHASNRSTADAFDATLPASEVDGGGAKGKAGTRVYVRLRSDDRLLLEARAEARGMKAATYVSVLTRCHLRRLTPLAKDELLALRRSIGELAALGRNINQIARVANEGGRLPMSVQEEFLAMLKICGAMRDHTKALLKKNLHSWKSGYGEEP